jgi:hypothetical protein
VNTVAAVAFGSPTTTVDPSPLTPTDCPKWDALLGVVNVVPDDQTPDDKVNTVAAFPSPAPTTTVEPSPLTATDHPKRDAPFLVSGVPDDQTPDNRVNTITEFANGSPTTAVEPSPLTPTDCPNAAAPLGVLNPTPGSHGGEPAAAAGSPPTNTDTATTATAETIPTNALTRARIRVTLRNDGTEAAAKRNSRTRIPRPPYL